MQMNEMIAEAIKREINIETAELSDFQQLLEAAVGGTQKCNLHMTEERWLGLGLHLVSTLRRVKKGETLPTVDNAMLEQVDSDMQELSRDVLSAVQATYACRRDATEVLLLAVHFAAAKHSKCC